MNLRVLGWLNQPRDIAALAVYRMLMGGLMCFGALRFMQNEWIERLYLEPDFHFKYWGFEWVTVPGETGMYLLYSAIAATAFLVAIGLFYRIAMISFWCLFTYAELMDVTSYLNHYYFVSVLTFIMCFLSPHKAWSVDAWLRPQIQRLTLPAWQTYWLRFQVGLLYFYAGLAKFEPDWLLHAQPLNIWLPPLSGLPLLGPFLEMTWVHFTFSWFAFLFDTTIIAFMLWARTRIYAFAVILVFHLFTHLFFNIGLFPLIMVFSVLIYFESDWPRRGFPSSQNRAGIVGAAKTNTISSTMDLAWTPLRMALTTLVLVFCTIQFVMPLRHLAYPGSVLWHEQGMRFSWRVMLREKSGSVSYRVVDAQGQTVMVSPYRYLTEDQYREMAGQPDMILQLAHYVADDFNAQGIGPVQVFADTRVSLNGRAARPIIDPLVDLTLVRDGIKPASWITPSPVDPPPLQTPLTLVVKK
ncbi:MAG: HTTM domain-containing protein [Pseudomonadota bacterium]